MIQLNFNNLKDLLIFNIKYYRYLKSVIIILKINVFKILLIFNISLKIV